MALPPPAPMPGHIPSHRRERGWFNWPTRRWSLLRVDDWRVRTKLVVVLTIPMLGFISVAAIQTYEGITAANELAGFNRRVALGQQVTGLVNELQNERDHTAGLMSASPTTGRTGPARPTTALLYTDWTAVDLAVTQFRQAAQPVLGGQAGYAAIDSHLDELGALRRGVLGGWLRQGAVFDAYSKIISDLLGLLPAPTTATDETLARAVLVVRDVAQIKEFTAQVRGRLYAVCAAGNFGPGDSDVLADTRAQRRAMVDQLRADATTIQVDRYDNAAGGPAARAANRLEQAASTGDNPRVPVDAQQWWQTSSVALSALRAVEVSLLNDAMMFAAEDTQANWQNTVSGLAIVLLLLLIAVLAALVVSRSMVETLRRLRDHSLDVAQRSLPELINRLRQDPRDEESPSALAANLELVKIRSRDEVGELADAFTAVHRSAVRLAGEQAATRRNLDASLVNLARRSQILVERQLRALDALEAGETDPDVLEQLFRIDHLATRMRRNDENLLVLAGADTSRRRNQPLPLAAIVLAATAEVEHYPRVRSTVDDEVYLVGHATGDVIHLIAEVLENATVFSPPHTVVTVHGHPAVFGGAELVIRDRGIGMTDVAIFETNQQLATPASPDAAASERMGLIVVAHLAAKHRIGVELRAAEPGLTVHLRLPPALIADVPDEPDVELPAPWLAPQRRPARPTPPLAIEAHPAPVAVIDAVEVTAVEDNNSWWSRNNGAAGRHDTGGGVSPRDTGGGVRGGRDVDLETSSAGLPMRVPQAQLPGPDAPAPVWPPPSVATQAAQEPDPDEVSAVLTSFYRGVQRADSELADDVGPPLHHETSAGGEGQGAQT